MRYYEVLPADKSFHGQEALTYSFDKQLNLGQLVKIKLRNTVCNGIIAAETTKPSFQTTPITGLLQDIIIPKAHLELLKWMISFYPGSLGTTASLFAPSLLQKLESLDAIKPSGTKYSHKLPSLNQEQASAYKAISGKNDGSFIVQGVTGSGKTRLYTKLAGDSLAKNKSVIILTPEISLTAPIAGQFKDVFGDLVHINHSSLTPKQRLLLWQKAFTKDKPIILIGPRSSLFLPLPDIGLIVVDEFHEPAYKQESQPFYHANRVASMLSKLSSSKLVFGSATPPIIDYYLAEQKQAPIINLVNSAITGKKPVNKSVVVNLLDQDENSSHPLISQTLIGQLKEVLNRKEQAMLFINKRGSARSISCQNCGHKELCPNCDLPLVYHGDQHLVRCHTCGYSKQPPIKCPECNSADIYFSSPGTKAISANLAKIFPQAKIARFDKDNKKSERMENKYDETLNEVDIIVGTQTVAKGHDLPRLSLVAMLLAENSLDFPDYSSEERSYQLIKQLGGRVNRGHREGIFIIQTFNPDGQFIKTATDGNWKSFYEEQIKQRQQHGFPPFYSALKIESARKTRASAEQALNKLIDKLDINSSNLEILGPAPNFVEKKSSKWHWQLIIKSKNRSELTKLAAKIPTSFRLDIDPNNFL